MGELELDNCEYSTDQLAQAAYVTDSAANLQSYSEATIKTEGDYSLKAVANTSSGKKLVHTFSPTSDLTDVNNLKIDMRSNRTGENVKFTLLGDAASVTGGGPIEGYSFDFDGATVATLTSEIIAGTNMTYSFWVKNATFTGNILPVMGKAELTVGYVGLFYSGDFYVGAGTGTEQILWSMSGFTYTDWNHYVVVKTNTSVELFINGVSHGAQYISQVAPIDSLGHAQTNYMDGLIDEINIWDRALSAIEVGQLYNGGKGLYANTSVAPFSTNLLYAWHMDEGSGSTLVDSIGSNHATITNAETWGTDKVLHYPRTTKITNCLVHSGANDDYGYRTVDGLGTAASPFTANIWFKSTGGTDYMTAISWGTGTAGHPISLMCVRSATGYLYTETGSGANTIYSGASVVDDVWHMGTITYDGDKMEMYVDAVSQGSNSFVTMEITSTQVHVGDMAWATGYQWTGSLDQATVWNRALTASEIAVLYNGRKGVEGTTLILPFSNGLLAGWDMDSGAGTSVADFSGNDETLAFINTNGSITSGTGVIEKEIPLTEVDGAYTTHTFLSSGTITNSAPIDCEVLLVAGGGGGACGGGGAGGVLYSSSITLAAGTHNVTVGTGGAGVAVNTAGGDFRADSGADSVLSTLTAVGGGGAGNTGNTGYGDGKDGGSGGGGGAFSGAETFGGTGTSGQGYAGGGNAAYVESPYPSGGGGGWTEVGGDAKNANDSGDGGDGDTHALLYNNFYVGGGGGGGTYGEGAGGTGGLGGGGKGPPAFGPNGDNGVTYTGGGGGGAPAFYAENNTIPGIGGTGGSGMIVIKYITPSTAVIAEYTPNIVVANQWQTINWNISDISNSLKNAVTKIEVEIVDATSANTFYLDNFNIAQAIDVFGWVE